MELYVRNMIDWQCKIWVIDLYVILRFCSVHFFVWLFEGRYNEKILQEVNLKRDFYLYCVFVKRYNVVEFGIF
jgi:hypothetical protein